MENFKIGTPREFSGAEFDILIVSTFRFSVEESLGGFTDQNDFEKEDAQNKIDLQALQMIFTRSVKFLWFVGSLKTLEAIGEPCLNSLSNFVKSNPNTYRLFENQEDWKRNKISQVIYAQSEKGIQSRFNSNMSQSHSQTINFHEERKNAQN